MITHSMDWCFESDLAHFSNFHILSMEQLRCVTHLHFTKGAAHSGDALAVGVTHMLYNVLLFVTTECLESSEARVRPMVR